MLGASGRFPRGRRLLKSAEFQRIFRGNTCRISNAGFTMLAIPNGQAHPRLGLALTKRYVKRAVDRNRIRRQLRESFRLHQQQLCGYDIVIVGRAGIDEMSSRDLRAAADRSWEHLAKRCKKS